MATPYVRVELGTVISTQREARARFEGLPLLVTAEGQTGGRGRLGRDWIQAPRAVSASLAVEPGWPESRMGVLPLIAGLAAGEAAGKSVSLKWPNDLILGGRKIGGILIEAAGPLVVVGFGLNLWWPDPIEGAGALLGIDPGPRVPGRVAEQWADDFLERMAKGPGGWGREEYSSACSTLGMQITWEPDGSGTAVAIGGDGGLVVSTPGGEVVLDSGEISEVRPAS